MITLFEPQTGTSGQWKGLEMDSEQTVTESESEESTPYM